MNEIFGWVIRNIELILIGMMVLMMMVMYIELNRRVCKLEKALLIAIRFALAFDKDIFGEGLGRMKVMEEKEKKKEEEEELKKKKKKEM